MVAMVVRNGFELGSCGCGGRKEWERVEGERKRCTFNHVLRPQYPCGHDADAGFRGSIGCAEEGLSERSDLSFVALQFQLREVLRRGGGWKVESVW